MISCIFVLFLKKTVFLEAFLFILCFFLFSLVILLLVECGEEKSLLDNTDLLKIFSDNSIALISVYTSPVCLSMVNYIEYNANSTYKFYYKLVPVDFYLPDPQDTANKLDTFILDNLTNFNQVNNFKQNFH